MDISETGLERPISENMADYFITARETLLSDIMSGSQGESDAVRILLKTYKSVDVMPISIVFDVSKGYVRR